MSVTLRPVRPSDAAAICEIYNPFIADSIITFETVAVDATEIQRRIAEITATYPWLIAERAGAVVGYAYATRWRARAAYALTVETAIYVRRGTQGSGVGTLLYIELLSLLRARGMHAAIGGISLPNPESVAFHERCGFVKVAHFPQVGRKFDAWVDVGFWQCIL